MSEKYAKILNHPDRDQVTSKLASGESVRSVANWLKEKYPKDRQNHIAYQTLDEFRKNFLNISGAVLDDLKDKFREQQIAEVEQDLDIVVRKNKTYNELKKDALKKHVNLEEKILEIMYVMESRTQHLFDMAQKNPNNYKPDSVLLQYFDRVLHYIQELRKAQGSPDQIIQHNVTVQTIDSQVAIIQQAIQEAVSELDLETGSLVMEKIVSKLEKLKYQEAKLFDAKDEAKINALEGKFLPLKTEEDDD